MGEYLKTLDLSGQMRRVDRRFLRNILAIENHRSGGVLRTFWLLKTIDSRGREFAEFESDAQIPLTVMTDQKAVASEKDA